MSDLADAIAFVGRWRPKESDARALAVVVAAARERLRLSRIPCVICGGTGQENSLVAAVTPGGKSCPSCGGSGEVWPAELVREIAITITGRRPFWPMMQPSIQAEFKEQARAVLDAISDYLKAGVARDD